MLRIDKPGLLTTIQDQGRRDFQHVGVVTSGAMDQVSPRIANWLTGNHGSECVLEITMIGPTITFFGEALIAICGADLSPEIDGMSVRNGRSIYVKKDAILRFGKCVSGCRAYLAIAGGFHIPEVLHSKSTYLLAGIGGYHGRALQKNDQLQTGNPSALAEKMLQSFRKNVPINRRFMEQSWSIHTSFISAGSNAKKEPLHIRVLKGIHFSWFDQKSKDDFFKKTFQLSSESDRMGYRLEGVKLKRTQMAEILSEAVRFGTIQVPGDGNPIVLMADSQTTGGYPKIAEAASIDLPVLAQAKPGDKLVFAEISLAKAHQLLWQREESMKIVQYQIQAHFQGKITRNLWKGDELDASN